MSQEILEVWHRLTQAFPPSQLIPEGYMCAVWLENGPQGWQPHQKAQSFISATMGLGSLRAAIVERVPGIVPGTDRLRFVTWEGVQLQEYTFERP